MAQPAKKPTNHKKSQHTPNIIGATQDIQEKVIEMERDGVEDVMRITDSVNRATRECVGICSDNLSALVESGSKISRLFQNISSEVMESSNRMLSDLAEFSREALSCRTIKDVVNLQSNATQQLLDNYFEETNKLSAMLFDCCQEAMEPLNERAAVTSERIRKTLAA